MRKTESILPISLFFDLDKSGPVPLHHQVASIIEGAIVRGELAVGSRLESEVAFADRLGLSRPTIRRAIQNLVDLGVLVRRRGVGTQVVHGQVRRGLELTSFHDDLVETGQAPSTKVIEFGEMAPCEDIASRLGMPAEEPILFFKRIRSANGVPVSIMQNWLRLTPKALRKSDLEKYGLYQLLQVQGVTLSVARQRIGARQALVSEAELLDVEQGSALLTMERLSFDSNGQAFELGRHVYRHDLYSFETTLVKR
jgi:DNA-binding GntR family transcriptional regulator